MKQLAQEAIDIQRAWNAIGVAQGLAHSMLELRALFNKRQFMRLKQPFAGRA
jgi:hypothetical protein